MNHKLKSFFTQNWKFCHHC